MKGEKKGKKEERRISKLVRTLFKAEYINFHMNVFFICHRFIIITHLKIGEAVLWDTLYHITYDRKISSMIFSGLDLSYRID